MRILTALIGLGLFVLPASAQSAAQLAEHARYTACLAMTEDEPDAAFADAVSWSYEGGGWPARHCHGRALIALGDTARGAEMLESVASIERPGLLLVERLGMWREAGEAWMALDEPVEAAGAYSVAMALSEDYLPGFEGHLRASLALGHWNDALSDADHLVENAPGLWEAWSGRAEARLELGEPDLALEDIEQARQLAPDNIDILVLRGRILEAIRQAG
ncbi:tetratricopeptide repeat protein [Maricaulis sp.]|uniref:tetratricopeptide repeat protein n=1 Tax=Maricaulis sp. TaxID=1486257 RepID=UPI0026141223|nr:tetratricopeptide repeat protein [Maricaulis sp.]